VTITEGPLRPPAFDVLERGIDERRRVRLRYRGHDRIVCPHALGRNNGRIVAFVYQCDGMTTGGSLPTNPRQRWRSMFVDNIEHAAIIDGGWSSADNYSPTTIPMGTIILAIRP